MKYLLVLIVLIIAYNIWRKQRRLDDAAKRPGPRPRTPAITQEMVPCAHCGLMLPKGEALQSDARTYFCCEEHQRSGRK